VVNKSGSILIFLFFSYSLVEAQNNGIKNLVFEGAGLRGIAYCGAIKELESRKLIAGIEKVGGTSAGAVTALCISLGYNSDEIEKLLFATNFKKFNDAWGHPTGDQVLCLVAMEVRQKVGKSGIVARLSGAQFAVVLPNAQIDAARALADQIRCAIMSRDITLRSTSQKLGRVSLSFGIVTAQADEDTDSLVFRVQGCLRAAKERGRNRVVCENELATPAPELRVGFG